MAVPETTLHEPVPTEGGLAPKVMLGDEIQMDCVVPAFETVGALSTCMVRLEVLKHPPFTSFHCSTFDPTLKLVTEVVLDPGAVIVPLPVTTDQTPTPSVGGLAASIVVGELIHKVWLAPANEVPGTL